jgi:hypothetical protein
VPKAAGFGNVKMDINLIKCILLELISFISILRQSKKTQGKVLSAKLHELNTAHI